MTDLASRDGFVVTYIQNQGANFFSRPPCDVNCIRAVRFTPQKPHFVQLAAGSTLADGGGWRWQNYC